MKLGVGRGGINLEIENVSHPASTNEEFYFLRSKQILEWRLIGDHLKSFLESFELSFHALVQYVFSIQIHKLL